MSVRSGIVDIYGSRSRGYLITEFGQVLLINPEDPQGGALLLG